jgi:uncharacterized protein with HEPN domain
LSGLRDYKLYLHDIKEAVEKIETFIKGFSLEEFVKDAKTVDAVIRNLEIMGEAAKHIPKRVKEKHPDIDWKAMAGMRNILTHEYFGVRMGIIWKTIRERLPALRYKIEEILKEGKD